MIFFFGFHPFSMLFAFALSLSLLFQANKRVRRGVCVRWWKRWQTHCTRMYKGESLALRISRYLLTGERSDTPRYLMTEEIRMPTNRSMCTAWMNKEVVASSTRMFLYVCHFLCYARKVERMRRVKCAKHISVLVKSTYEWIPVTLNGMYERSCVGFFTIAHNILTISGKGENGKMEREKHF